MDFAEIDLLLNDNENVPKVYAIMKKAGEADPSTYQDAEFLWRFSKVCHMKAALADKNHEKKEFLLEGREYAQKAAKLNGKHLNSVKYAAILTGAAVEHLPLTEKVRNGKLFKDYLDAALAIDDSECGLLHLRGRYSYSVSQMSWIERKAVNAFFSDPPKATIEDAVTDLEMAQKILQTRPDWVDNLLFLGKSYMIVNEKKLARDCFERCITQPALDDNTVRHINEAKQLLNKV